MSKEKLNSRFKLISKNTKDNCRKREIKSKRRKKVKEHHLVLRSLQWLLNKKNEFKDQLLHQEKLHNQEELLPSKD